jgi:arylsulfatase A-like enzyme
MRADYVIAAGPMALAALACGCQGQKKAEPTAKPNVILIVADDLGVGDVGAYGQDIGSTPNLDSIAAHGLLMHNAFATSATSTPSRYGIFTGLYPWTNPMAHILAGNDPLIIAQDQPTMPKMFQEAGYVTGAVGKWHLGMGNGDVDWNKHIDPDANTVGFDYTNLLPATVDRVPTVYVENGTVVGLDPDDPIYVDYKKPFEGEPTYRTNPELCWLHPNHGHDMAIVNGVPRIGYMKGGKKALWKDDEMAEYILDKAEKFVTENKDKPFFLYYGLHEPHVCRVPAKQFAGKTNLGSRGDVIMEADWCVGQLIHHLDSLGLLENTLVIFTSDNGAVLQDGYEDQALELAQEHNYDPSYGLRGGKYSLYNGGTHIPFIVYWKGAIKPAVSKAYFCQVDLYASLGKLIGGNVPDSLESQPLTDVLLGKQLDGGREVQVMEAQGKLALRWKNYEMIPPYAGNAMGATHIELGNSKEYALYDMDADPREQHNLAAEQPELLEEMKKMYAKLVGSYYNSGLGDMPLQ